MFVVKDIAYAAYPSDDVAGTRAWYERVLGLTFAGPYVEDGLEKYNEAHLASGTFSLMASEWVARDPGAGSGVALEVDDLEAAVAQLRSTGIVVTDIEVGPVCKQSTLTDPEGNRITLHQKNAGR